MFRPILKFLVDDDGPTSVEYAVMLAFVILAAWVGLTNFGSQAQATWNSVGQSMGSSPFGS